MKLDRLHCLLIVLSILLCGVIAIVRLSAESSPSSVDAAPVEPPPPARKLGLSRVTLEHLDELASTAVPTLEDSSETFARIQAAAAADPRTIEGRKLYEFHLHLAATMCPDYTEKEIANVGLWLILYRKDWADCCSLALKHRLPGAWRSVPRSPSSFVASPQKVLVMGDDEHDTMVCQLAICNSAFLASDFFYSPSHRAPRPLRCPPTMSPKECDEYLQRIEALKHVTVEDLDRLEKSP